jgi:hypothetical protein
LDLLIYARDNNKILSVYSHHIVEEVTEEYQTSIATMEMICKFVRVNNMKFYTISELKDMVN